MLTKREQETIVHYEALEVTMKHTDLLSQSPSWPFSLHITVIILGHFIQNVFKNLLYSKKKMYLYFCFKLKEWLQKCNIAR